MTAEMFNLAWRDGMNDRPVDVAVSSDPYTEGITAVIFAWGHPVFRWASKVAVPDPTSFKDGRWWGIGAHTEREYEVRAVLLLEIAAVFEDDFAEFQERLGKGVARVWAAYADLAGEKADEDVLRAWVERSIDEALARWWAGQGRAVSDS